MHSDGVQASASQLPVSADLAKYFVTWPKLHVFQLHSTHSCHTVRIHRLLTRAHISNPVIAFQPAADCPQRPVSPVGRIVRNFWEIPTPGEMSGRPVCQSLPVGRCESTSVPSVLTETLGRNVKPATRRQLEGVCGEPKRKVQTKSNLRGSVNILKRTTQSRIP